MIEAIPISPECLVLVITKVEDPDELDTRFSKFSTSSDNDESSKEPNLDSYTDDLINCFDQLNELLDDGPILPTDKEEEEDSSSEKEVAPATEVNIPVNLYKVFSFKSLDEVIHMSAMIVGTYQGENTLYKDDKNHIYYLTIYKSSHSPEEYSQICNLISEYGTAVKSTYATANYFEEHFETIVKQNAIQILSVM